MRYKTGLAALAFTIFGLGVKAQQPVAFRQISQADSVAKFIMWVDKEVSPQEKQCHSLIWKLRDIRKAANELMKKGSYPFTMTDEWPSPESEYYVVGFYEMKLLNNMMDKYVRLTTYRIDRKMKMERYNPEDDSWAAVTSVRTVKN
ncbi:MAG TPA: hypothetical protein VGD40_02865 [Chryseosolibacter sp.]